MYFESNRGAEFFNIGKIFSFDLRYIFLIFITLIAPAVSFDIYYILIFILFLPFFIFSKKEFERYFAVTILFILFSLLANVIFKSIFFGNLYDIKEFVKIVLFAYVFLSVKDSSLNNFHVALLVFIFFDSTFSFLQFFHISYFFEDTIALIFNSASHYEFSSSLNSVRALGLSPGPGQHGTLAVFSLSFFLIRYSFSSNSRSSLVGIFLSFIIVMLSQSKTAIVISVITFINYSVLIILVKKKFSSVIYITSVLLIVCYLIFTYWESIISIFYDLKRLSESGLRVSSMDARISIWKEQLNALFNSGFFFILFGCGRSYLEYLGVYHNSFDNDYVYLLVSYGVFGFLLFFVWFIFLLYKSISFSKQSQPVQVLIFIVWSGLFTAFTLDFFSDVKIIALLAYLTRVCCNSNNYQFKF